MCFSDRKMLKNKKGNISHTVRNMKMGKKNYKIRQKTSKTIKRKEKKNNKIKEKRRQKR